MPKSVERCVKKVKGTHNKRTGKPFTESEAWAVCRASHKKKYQYKGNRGK